MKEYKYLNHIDLPAARKFAAMKRRYEKPVVPGTVPLVLVRRFCAGSDIMQDAELEAVGIQTDDYDFSKESNPFEFSWEETL